jgi:hypothetical protein
MVSNIKWIAHFAMCIFVAGIPAAAIAGGGGVGQACKMDVRHWCGSKTDLSSYIPSCLSSHMADLSPGCQAKIKEKQGK